MRCSIVLSCFSSYQAKRVTEASLVVLVTLVCRVVVVRRALEDPLDLLVHLDKM